MRPHADLDDFYPDSAARRSFVDSLFDATAADYDRVNAIMALGTGVRYRRDALRRGGLRPSMRVLDVATGTGLVCRAARQAGVPAANILGLDPSAGMLAHHAGRGELRLARGRADRLPLADGSFDFVVMGYALRHVEDLTAALRELHRVLVVSGRILLLEISQPQTRLAQVLARAYFGRLVPRLARVGSKCARTKELMDYYWATIAACVPPAAILDALAAAGFARVRRHVVLGIFSEYQAERSAV